LPAHDDLPAVSEKSLDTCRAAWVRTAVARCRRHGRSKIIV
jgi:hypothetical protein